MKKQDDREEKVKIVPEEQEKVASEDDLVQKLQIEVEEWKNKYLRALADYQNLEKRSFQEKDELRKFAAEVTLRKFIPAVDSLERATKHVEDEGLALSLKEFYAALESCGVTRIKTLGEQFDPFLMECLEVVPGNDGVVVDELLSGYRLHDKILRVAQVKVGKNNK